MELFLQQVVSGLASGAIYASGLAVYERGEVHRIRGEYDAAEAAYKEASGYGCEPQPGLALLRLAANEKDVVVRNAVNRAMRAGVV